MTKTSLQFKIFDNRKEKNEIKKKTIALLLVLMMIFGVTCGGTIAYLTSTTDTITNTFTVGNVTITLDEVLVTAYGEKGKEVIKTVDGKEVTTIEKLAEGDKETRVTSNEYKLIPGHTYTKDPTIHVDTNSENCWLFVKVVDEIADIQDTTTVAAQMASNGWTAVSGETNVYAYKKIVEAGEDAPIFANFKIKGDAAVDKYTGKTISIIAYAIQADSFDTAADAWTAAPSNWTK